MWLHQSGQQYVVRLSVSFKNEVQIFLQECLTGRKVYFEPDDY